MRDSWTCTRSVWLEGNEKMRIADMFTTVVGSDSGVAVRAYDGSEFGPADPVATIDIKSPEAVAYIATAPSDLGLARAYVSGALDVTGDLHAALVALVQAVGKGMSPADMFKMAKSVHWKNLRRPPIPPQEARMKGWRHSKRRDASAISHHYDVSNTFYRMLLGPSMAYTCAIFPTPESSLEDAQEYKFDLVCRKLGLQPGMRLLDVGCGWGGMVVHAAREYGVEAIGVTLSAQQASYATKLIADQGLSDRAQVRFMDYRDVPESGFDRISSIGLTEHIGVRNYPSYFSFLHRKLRPGGRLLNHTITRNDGTQKAKAGGFISRYIFPDGELVGPAQVMGPMNDAGFEIQHEENIRKHYALTLKHWSENLEANWDAAVADVGLAKARTWRLYLAASRTGFDVNRIQLHQFLGSKTTTSGTNDYPWRPDFC